ncbi:MAG TPA: glycosyltransferase [Flavipsychrobacter sp.]|nr:glycosyltransferase [Flavipsychrobacter sp.]
MPKVLRILNRLIIGGPALNATYLTKYMAPDFETTLVIGGKDDHEQDADHITDNLGIDPVVIPEMKRSINPIHDGQAYRKVKELINKIKPDIVHTHAAKSGVIGRMAADACKVPVIIHTFHGHVFHSYFNKLTSATFIQIERYLAKRSNGIIAISKTQKEELCNTYKICPEKKINIIPLGLDLDKFQLNYEEKRLSFRHKFFIAEDEIAIGIIGRIVPVKNHSLFVAIAAKVLDQSGMKLKFIIVGDGESRQQTEMELKQANIDYAYYPEDKRNAQAICTSWQTDVDIVLAGLDIVMLTSHNEGTPVSLIEAQAAAKPVISTDVGGVSDVVLDHITGYVVEAGDADKFAAALINLIENPGIRQRFGQAGRKFVQDKFSYRRLVTDMSEYYYSLLEEKRLKSKKNHYQYTGK